MVDEVLADVEAIGTIVEDKDIHTQFLLESQSAFQSEFQLATQVKAVLVDLVQLAIKMVPNSVPQELLSAHK